MILGALISAGASSAEVSRAIEKLGVDFEITTESIQVGGMQALRLTVEHPEQDAHRAFGDLYRDTIR